MTLQRLYFLAVFVVADADDGNLGALDVLDKLCYAAAVPTRHSINFVHNDAHLFRSQTVAVSYKIQSWRELSPDAVDPAKCSAQRDLV